MSKARQFIKDCTRGCSNETTPVGSFDHTYHEWLTPEQALAAVEIAREELIDKACEYLEENLLDFWSQKITNTDYFIEDFKQAMEE